MDVRAKAADKAARDRFMMVSPGAAAVFCAACGGPYHTGNFRHLIGGSRSNQVYADCVDLSAVENASKQESRGSVLIESEPML
jgi:hypothetical protein